MRSVFLLLLIFFIGCKKDEHPVIVKGQAFDDIRKQPVKNLLVYIYDVQCENFGCHFNKVLDSTRTDANGRYEMMYYPKNSNTLHVACSFSPDTFVFADIQNAQPRISIGDNTVDFIIRKTTVLKARIVVTNNTFLPLRIFDNISKIPIEINGVNKDTVVYLRAVANKANLINLIAFEPGQIYYRKKTESIVFNSLADTFTVTIPADLSNYPQFKY
jgi:hypothetical protein